MSIEKSKEITPTTREELFFNALINGDSNIPEPKTREEELFVKLIEKINKPVYTTLYQFSKNYLYSKKEKLDEYILKRKDIKNLYKTSPLYFKKYDVDGEVLLDEGVITNISFSEVNEMGYVTFSRFTVTGNEDKLVESGNQFKSW